MQFTSIASGLYLEALAVDGDTIWYSDVIPGGVQRIPVDTANPCWLPGRQWIGGMMMNADGSVLASGPGGIVWFNPATGRSGTLLAEVDGKPLPGANEMCSDGKGGLYFGSLDAPAIAAGRKPAPAALYHLEVGGKVTQLCEGLAFTNGLSVSLDGKTLFHNESFVGVFAYPILPDGRLGERSLLLDKKDCDGMAMDERGRLWITGFRSNELLCVRPDGTIDQRVPVPNAAMTNVRFGGKDNCELFVCSVSAEAGGKLVRGEPLTTPDSVLYRGRGDVAGWVPPLPRFQLS